MRRYILFIIALAMFAFTACGGGSSAPTPNPGGNDPNVDVPDIPGGDTKMVTIEQRYPAPYESGSKFDIAIVKYQIPASELENMDKGISAYPNMDPEMMHPTINASALWLFNHQASTKTFNGGLGNWDHSFYWQTSDTGANRNTQGVTWIAVVDADKNHDIYDGATLIDGDIETAVRELLDTTPGLEGFLGKMYNDNNAADDTNPATSADRPYAYEVVLCSRVANYLNDQSYDLMALNWFENTTDELTGNAEVDRLLTAGRASLTLWDCHSRIEAAAVTQNYDWAEDMIAQLDTRRGDWDGVLLGGWDYTPLGWMALAGAITELKNTAGSISPLAQDYLDESLAFLNSATARHSVFGYYGFEQGGRIYDDSQSSGYALSSIGLTSFFDPTSATSSLLSKGNRCLEFYRKKILPMSDGFDLDSIAPTDDAGAILSNYRGPIILGDIVVNTEVTAETLGGLIDMSEAIGRYPDIPLY